MHPPFFTHSHCCCALQWEMHFSGSYPVHCIAFHCIALHCITIIIFDHHSKFSIISSSSSLTWSTRSTASSSSSCSSRRRRCWRVCNDCGDEGGRRMEWKQCFRRPATSLSLSPAPSVVCQVCQSTVSSVKPRRCHKMLCELTWNDVWEWQKVFSLYMFNILIIQWNVYYTRHPMHWV